MKKQDTSLVIIAVLMIIAAAFSRVFFYPVNYSPVIAMALFGGSVIKNKNIAFALPLFAMLLSDIMFEVFNVAQGFWGWGQLVGYGILAIVTLLGFKLRKINVVNVLGFSIASSIIFYFLSNSSYWLLENRIFHTYTQDAAGYVSCLIAGLPFLEKGLLVDAAFSSIFFAGFVLLERFAVRRSLAS